MSAKKKATPKKATTAVTRASVIDRELLKVGKGQEADWDKVADAVIKAQAAPSNAKDKIIAQAKVRHAWYVKGEKKNPAAKES